MLTQMRIAFFFTKYWKTLSKCTPKEATLPQVLDAKALKQ